MTQQDRINLLDQNALAVEERVLVNSIGRCGWFDVLDARAGKSCESFGLVGPITIGSPREEGPIAKGI
uniref:Uncharacterized protein n=1 Tax=Fusarium oxysporum (strain Fo5176) TaxID=660025 RepID=A0A0D2YFC7_FUSOF